MKIFKPKIYSKPIILFSTILFSLVCNCQTNDSIQKKIIEKNRFDYYELISKKSEIIKVKKVIWASPDKPTFIVSENIRKYLMFEYCFYLDTKNPEIQNFTPEVIADLDKGKAVRFYGKYYRTKQFDDVFPYKGFFASSFTPENGYFNVFVYDKCERIKSIKK